MKHKYLLLIRYEISQWLKEQFMPLLVLWSSFNHIDNESLPHKIFLCDLAEHQVKQLEQRSSTLQTISRGN